MIVVGERTIHRRSPRALLGAAFGALLFASACHDKAPPRVHAVAEESTVLTRVVRSVDASATTTESWRELDVGGKKRGYLLVSPTAVVAGRRYPLVLVMHGDGGDARGFHAAWPFERASGDDAYLAYLDGLGATWDLETTTGNRDVAFARAVITELAKRGAIDTSRVFATGYSSGGFFANVLACQEPGLLRAIASNSGGAPYKQREKWPNGYPKCPGQAPVAALALHGESDSTVTPDSGQFSAAYWAYVNGCTTTEMQATGYPECRVYRGCPPGKAVGSCSIPALGHWVWDEAADASWTFFQQK